MTKFWNFVKNEESGETELYFEGPISNETWWGDEITPAMFRDELAKVSGNLTVWINSPGGDCISASQIYTMLRSHKSKVTVKIDGIAASAASVVAMAGDETLISPTGYLMIHNPMTLASGNKSDMEKAIALLDEIKEGIINAYARKTGLSRNKISKLMDEETWLNAEKALQLGFVDGILFDEKKNPAASEEDETDKESDDNDSDEDKENPDKPQKNSSWQWGYDLMQNLINGIRYMIGNLINTVADVANSIWEYLHFSVPEKGPLTDFESWMPDFIGGLADGINKSKKLISKAVEGVANAMQISLNSDIGLSLDGISSPMKNNPAGTIINNYDNSRTVNQTNNSPKSLSRLEIYRQTRNALNM